MEVRPAGCRGGNSLLEGDLVEDFVISSVFEVLELIESDLQFCHAFVFLGFHHLSLS